MIINIYYIFSDPTLRLRSGQALILPYYRGDKIGLINFIDPFWWNIHGK